MLPLVPNPSLGEIELPRAPFIKLKLQASNSPSNCLIFMFNLMQFGEVEGGGFCHPSLPKKKIENEEESHEIMAPNRDKSGLNAKYFPSHHFLFSFEILSPF